MSSTEKATNEKNVVELKVANKVSFPGTLKTNLTTTAKLCELVGEFLLPVFPDYDGAYIQLANGTFQVSVFFRDKVNADQLGNGQFKAVRNTLGDKTGKSDSMMDRIRSMNAVNSSRNITLTDEVMSALEPYMTKFGNNKVNWSQCCAEVAENTYGGQYIYMKVTGLDLNKIIREIYGNKISVDGVDHLVDYAIQPIRPLSMAGGNDVNYLVNVLLLDNVEVAKLCNSVGIMPVQGQISKIMPSNM